MWTGAHNDNVLGGIVKIRRLEPIVIRHAVTRRLGLEVPIISGVAFIVPAPKEIVPHESDLYWSSQFFPTDIPLVVEPVIWNSGRVPGTQLAAKKI